MAGLVGKSKLLAEVVLRIGRKILRTLFIDREVAKKNYAKKTNLWGDTRLGLHHRSSWFRIVVVFANNRRECFER